MAAALQRFAWSSHGTGSAGDVSGAEVDVAQVGLGSITTSKDGKHGAQERNGEVVL